MLMKILILVIKKNIIFWLNSNEIQPSLKILSDNILFEDAKFVWINKMI